MTDHLSRLYRRISRTFSRWQHNGFVRALIATPFISAFVSLGLQGLGYVAGYLAATFAVMVALGTNERAKRLVNIAGNAAFAVYGAVFALWPVIALNVAFAAWHLWVIRGLAPDGRVRA